MGGRDGESDKSGSPRELYQPPKEEVPPDGRTSRFDNTLRFWQGGVAELRAGRGPDVRLGNSFYVLREMGEADRGLTMSRVYGKKIAINIPMSPPPCGNVYPS